MKVDLVYPKIPENSNKFFDKCIAFEKYDGTNLHWRWTLSDGWHLFGTRRTQFKLNSVGIDEFNLEHSELKNAVNIFNEQFRDSLTVFLCQHVRYFYNKMDIFTEFYGPNSFAGGHSWNDEDNGDQKLVIIDVAKNDKIIPPQTLIDDFGTFNIAKVIYTGKYSGQFAEDVRNGKYDVDEGVVCKGLVDGEVFMTKVKTKDYLKRLKNR